MDETERLSALIDDIYDAVLNPASWLRALERSTQFVGGVASTLSMKNPFDNRCNFICSWGFDPNYRTSDYQKYVRFAPLTIAPLFAAIGQVISATEIVLPSDYRRSPFYTEWVQPQGWFDTASVTIEKSAKHYINLLIMRHEDDGSVDDDMRRRMSLVAPHVRRAFEICKVMDLHTVEAAEIAESLDGLAAGVILVDSAGRVLHANEVGRLILLEGSVVRVSKGKFTAIDANANRSLHDAFVSASDPNTAVSTGSTAVPLLSRDADRYVAHVLPLTSGARHRANVTYRAVAAVFICRATLEALHPLEVLANVYKLTPAEMRVLMMIVEIGGVPEVAPVLGVSEATVKTHLQRIFAKTETTRQADLVKIVAAYISPLRSPNHR